LESQRNPKKRAVSQEANQSKLIDKINASELYTYQTLETLSMNTKFGNSGKHGISDKNDGTKQKSFLSWSFGTINIRSGKETGEGSKLYMVAKEAARANLLICCLQEVKYRNDGKKLITLDSGEKYIFI
jgi:hypothetical protein